MRRRDWIFLIVASALVILAGRGIGPYSLAAGSILVLGLILMVEWSVPTLLGLWALLSIPLVTLLGASEETRNRIAVLVLTLLATGLARLIAECRGTSKQHDLGPTNAHSPNGKVEVR